MPYTQERRNLRVTTPLGEDVLLAAGLAGVEGISRLFEYQLELFSEDDALDFDALVGKAMTVHLRTEDGERTFHGHVASFVQETAGTGLARYRAQLVPWLWFLGRRRNCRIFQDLAVPDILEKIFAELGFSDHESKLEGSYEKREFCVQYRETDLAFVLRLMEEEGVWFFFRHEEDRHVLVLADSPAAHEACPGQEEIQYRPTPTGRSASDHLFQLTREQHFRSAAVRLTDYNFETPSLDLAAQKQAEHGEAKWELYDYPGKYPDPEQGARYAALRIEAETATRVLFRGSSYCRALLAGTTVTVQDHPRDDLNAAYLVTELQFRASEGSGYGTGDGGEESSYQNTFEAVPSGTLVRPPLRTPRPLVEGPQTAVVVGPKGEEIHTDRYGRVKVQFHWDRDGKRDDKSSCWIRVSMGWAGKNWGAFALPRIGQEVIVDFLEGDPDRPILTGRVYHAESMPPYELPGEQTKSTIKSRSSKGGGPANFNEIRMEDKKGSEELYVHAEKDKKVVVENDRNEDVGRDETISIGRNRTETVAAEESITIGANRTEKVAVNETITIGGNRSEQVAGNETVTIVGARALTVSMAAAESVGLAKALTIGGAYQVSVGAAMNETVAGLKSEEVGADRIELVGGKHKVSVKDDLEHSVGGSAKITVKRDLEHGVDGAYECKAKEIKLTAETKITLAVGSSLLVIEPASISITSPLVRINC